MGCGEEIERAKKGNGVDSGSLVVGRDRDDLVMDGTHDNGP